MTRTRQGKNWDIVTKKLFGNRFHLRGAFIWFSFEKLLWHWNRYYFFVSFEKKLRNSCCHRFRHQIVTGKRVHISPWQNIVNWWSNKRGENKLLHTFCKVNLVITEYLLICKIRNKNSVRTEAYSSLVFKFFIDRVNGFKNR